MSTNFYTVLADLVIRRRILLIILGFIIAICFAAGMGNLKFETDGRVFFDENNPDRIALDEFEAEYSKDDSMIMIISPKDGKIFTKETLNFIGQLTADSWLLPYVRTVNSLTNFQSSYSENDDLIVSDLIPDIENISSQDINKAKFAAENRIELKNQFVNANHSISQVNVLFRLPGLNPVVEIPFVMGEVNELVKKYKDINPNIDIKLAGLVPTNAQFAKSAQDDGSTLTPLMIVATLLAVAILLRAAVGVGLVFIIIILCSLVSMGSLGWSGNLINNATVIAPLMVMTLTVASAVHVLSSVRQTMLITDDKKVWARRAIIDHGPAITVACLTTAIGFFSLNFSISPPFRQLGTIVGIGMFACLFYTLTMLPALITLLPYKKQTSQAFMDKVMSNLAEFVIAQKNFLMITTTAVIVFLGFGITQLKLEDDFLRYFDTKYELRQATDYYENNVGGLNALEYNIRTQSDSGINDIEYLNKVDQLIAYMRAQPEISSVRGYTDVLKRLNQNMNGDDKSFYKIPDTNIEAAQYLFLYELSLAYGLDLTDQINIDKSGLRLTAYVPNTTSSAFLNLDLRIQNWMAENAPELNTPATGQSVVYNKISSRDAPAMLKGTGYALIGISFIILLVLRNIKYGIISLIPNLLPAVMAFGLWGYSVGSVTLAVSIVVAMTLGIVVDDSVHFMLKYAKARKKGLSPEDSVRDSFKNVGMALTITSIGLVIGFSILAQSGFAVNKDMAMLTAITIGFALFVDYLLLPPILMAVDKFKLRGQTT